MMESPPALSQSPSSCYTAPMKIPLNSLPPSLCTLIALAITMGTAPFFSTEKQFMPEYQSQLMLTEG